jgi:hypothetical protein
MQHIFVRHTARDGTDGIDVRRNGTTVPRNIIIDHVSVSWGDDENLSFAPGGDNETNNNVTYSNNIIAEGEGSKYGTLISDGTSNLSVIRNIWISHSERQPRVKGKVKGNLINNVSYNFGSNVSTVIGSATGPNYLSIVGNVCIAGPDSPGTFHGFGAAADIVKGSRIYLHDNLCYGVPSNDRLKPYLVDDMPVSLDGISVLPALEVLDFVMANAGARPGERDGIVNNEKGDPIDERLLHEVKTGTGALLRSASKFSAINETNRIFPVPGDSGGDADGDGYTNIEEILHLMASAVEHH